MPVVFVPLADLLRQEDPRGSKDPRDLGRQIRLVTRDDERERLVVERKSGLGRSRFLIDIVGSICADDRYTEWLEARGGERKVWLVTL